MRLILYTLLCATFAATAIAAEDWESQVDEIFSKWDSPDSPGCSVAIARNGEILYAKGFGMASLEYSVPITPSTIFHVASVSKQFAAFAILLLEDEGKLSIDDDIRDHLPELHDFGVPIRIHHLIHHTSGLRDQWDLLAMSSWRMSDVITTDDIWRLLLRQRNLNFTPGERHLYSNTGYTLLGLIVERVSGKSLKEFCQEFIFDPLGMTDTHFHDDHSHIVPNRADTYAPDGDDGFKRSVLSFSTVGATSLFTTVEDQIKWLDNFRTHKVGSEAVHEAMLVPGLLNNGVELNYASGVSVGPFKGIPSITHGGADAGYRSMVATFPEQGISIALHANLASVSSSGVTNKIVDIVLAGEIEDPESNETEENRDAFISLTKEQLKRYKGIYVDIASGAYRRVNVAKDQLRFIVEGQSFQLMSPVSETVFRPTANPGALEITFDTSEGEPSELSVESRGSAPLVFKRAGKRRSDPEYLSEIAGRYYSEELDTFWSVVLKDDKALTVHRRKYNDRTLRAGFEDGFASGGNTFFFTRNDSGETDGFHVTTGRVIALRFDKVTN